MQRYFASIVNNNVIFSEGDIFHIEKVMRGKINDEIIVIDKSKNYLAKITSTKPLKVEVIKEIDENNELKAEVNLLFCLAKGDKIDFVIQKATELGAKNIYLVKSSRSIVKMSKEDFLRKRNRYITIAKEAGEQSHRNIIPNIDGVYDINNLPKEVLGEVNLIAYENDRDNNDLSFIKNKKSISILIGPEGGFSSDEVSNLIKKGFISISLGKRILRTETAAVSALSVISYLLEK